jgi:hypothetical protein
MQKVFQLDLQFQQRFTAGRDNPFFALFPSAGAKERGALADLISCEDFHRGSAHQG